MKNIRVIIILIFILFMAGCNDNKKITKPNSIKEANKEVSKFQKAEYFFEYEDEVYFWKQNKQSTSKEGVHNIYDILPKVENELVKIDNKGNETSIYKGEGNGKIIIYKDHIYTSYLIGENTNERMVFSINMKGKKEKEYGIGFIEYLIGDNIICKTGYYDGDIVSINVINNEYITLIKNALLIGIDNEDIYYGSNSSDYKDCTIGVTDINGKNKEIITVKTSNFEYTPTVIYPKFFIVDGKLINIYLGYTDGTANVLQELYKVVIKNKDAVQNGLVSTDEFTQLSNRSSFEDDVYMTYSDKENVIAYYKDNIEKKIISFEDLKDKYDLENDDEHLISIEKGSLTNSDAYFIINYGTHKADGDIGWRYNYLRNKTLYFKYNINNKKLEKIYEY